MRMSDSSTYRAQSSVGDVSDDGTYKNEGALLPITIGTALWAVLGVGLIIGRTAIPDGNEWWLVTCAVAVVSGLGGIVYLRRRARRTSLRQD
jgi:hypothetical protein